MTSHAHVHSGILALPSDVRQRSSWSWAESKLSKQEAPGGLLSPGGTATVRITEGYVMKLLVTDGMGRHSQKPGEGRGRRGVRKRRAHRRVATQGLHERGEAKDLRLEVGPDITTRLTGEGGLGRVKPRKGKEGRGATEGERAHEHGMNRHADLRVEKRVVRHYESPRRAVGGTRASHKKKTRNKQTNATLPCRKTDKKTDKAQRQRDKTERQTDRPTNQADRRRNRQIDRHVTA